MVCLQIQFHSMDDIIDFVNQCNHLEYQMDLVCDRFIVNAKSLLGICSIDLTKSLNLLVHTENAEKVYSAIRTYIV